MLFVQIRLCFFTFYHPPPQVCLEGSGFCPLCLLCFVTVVRLSSALPASGLTAAGSCPLPNVMIPPRLPTRSDFQGAEVRNGFVGFAGPGRRGFGVLGCGLAAVWFLVDLAETA